MRLGEVGLSPLARGNPQVDTLECLRQGPIPARAGEPYLDGWSQCSKRAYPRSRGGTMIEPIARMLAKGLSPLARGNQVDAP